MDNYFKLIFILILVSFSSVSHSLVKPIGFTNSVRSTAIGMRSTVKFSTQTGIATKVINISKATLGLVARKRLFSPWGFGIAALLATAGYVLNETTNDIEFQSTGTTELGNCSVSSYALISLNDCMAQVTAFDDGKEQFLKAWVPGTEGYSIARTQTTWWVVGYWIPDSGYIGEPETLVSGIQLFSDPELADVVLDNFTDTEISNHILTDPSTTFPDTDIVEIDPVISELQIEDDLLTDADPLNDPLNPTERRTQEQALLDELIDSNNKLQETLEKQNDSESCQDNPNSLACTDLGEDLLEEEILNFDMPVTYSPVSLNLNAVCPSPPSVALSSGAVDLDNSLICDFAIGIKPIVLVAFTLMALLVLNGGLPND